MKCSQPDVSVLGIYKKKTCNREYERNKEKNRDFKRKAMFFEKAVDKTGAFMV